MPKKVKPMENKQKVYRLQGLTCTDCAAKFEKNIRNIESVEDVQLNFGASKVTVFGEATIEQIVAAGAFDKIKVYPERERKVEVKEPFWKKQENISVLISVAFIMLGYFFYFQFGIDQPITI